MGTQLNTLSAEQKHLLTMTMDALDKKYSEERGFLMGRGGHGDVRSSMHYALGLLMRGGAGDLERACRVIGNVLDCQHDYPDEIFHGTFRRRDTEPTPPVGQWPWKEFSAENRWWADRQGERIFDDLRKTLVQQMGYDPAEAVRVEEAAKRSIIKYVPNVWVQYDPNWREFIGITSAMVLELFDSVLPPALVARIEAAMEKTVTGSITRYDRNLTPMNTNVELMHIFICDYFGARLHNKWFTESGARDAETCWRKYEEFHSFAEYNSPTYCGVDLTALALWRAFGRSARIRELGAKLEAGLWEDLGKFYNANLHNISGPFSRGYEMELSLHTSLPALLYMALGEERAPVPALNCEDDGNVLIVLGNTKMPAALETRYVEHTQDRQITEQFRELIERGEPARNNPLCTATAWIEKDLMLGGLRGSENTSGQLRAGTVYWKAPDGTVSSMRLARRAVGEDCNHYRTIFFNVTVDGREMELDVRFDVNRDIELFFDILGTGVENAQLSQNEWLLPGLKITLLEQRVPAMKAVRRPGALETVYLFDSDLRDFENMHLKLRFELV